jgi:5-methylcytosine-specific restriction endonuclease McrA
MGMKDFSIGGNFGIFGSKKANTKKRKNVSFTEKAILWEKNKRHICHICKREIHSMTEGQVDHIRANSKGGQRIAWAHASCNRIKGNKPLSQVQKRLGVYKPKARKKKKKARGNVNPFGLSPITMPNFRL